MQEVKIIIPNQTNDGQSLEATIEAVQMNMCTLFGGFTAYAAQGGWMDPEGQLYKEPVTVITSAVAADKAEDAQLIIAIARNVLELTDQLAVFVSINGNAEIIE